MCEAGETELESPSHGRGRGGKRKEKEASPGLREVSERSQMFDTRTVFRFTVTGIMLDYAGEAVLFGRSHTGKQNRRCRVASLHYSSVQIFIKVL